METGLTNAGVNNKSRGMCCYFWKKGDKFDFFAADKQTGPFSLLDCLWRLEWTTTTVLNNTAQ